MARATPERSRPDPTSYPETDHMGESLLQRRITELLAGLVATWLARRGERALVGANQFIYYRQHASSACVAPDVYVLPGVDPDRSPSTWKVWETGIVPCFALECVSDDWLKDYRDAPARYQELGVDELVIFDPDPETRGGQGLRWQVFRRTARRGLQRIATSQSDRVRSEVLGAWLRAVGVGDGRRVRLGLDPLGDQLLPTDTEAARARADAEAARADAATARAIEAEGRAEAALAELARLREELARRR